MGYQRETSSGIVEAHIVSVQKSPYCPHSSVWRPWQKNELVILVIMQFTDAGIGYGTCRKRRKLERL